MEIFILLLVAVGPAVVLTLARPSAIVRRGRNAWVGIRTPNTMESDQAWVAGHKAAWPTIWVSCTAALLVLLGLFVILVAVPDWSPEWLLPAAAIVDTTVWTAGVIAGGVVADRAAKRAMNVIHRS